jgi:hypothetical protein
MIEEIFVTRVVVKDLQNYSPDLSIENIFISLELRITFYSVRLRAVGLMEYA